jgi:hypothetical protein
MLMDDNTRQFLVALASALGGLLTGVVIAKLGFDFSQRQQRASWEREDALRRVVATREADRPRVLADRQRRELWLDRRRELYAAVIATTFRVALGHGRNDPEVMTAAWAAAAEVELIRPELGRLAFKLVGAAIDKATPPQVYTDLVQAFQSAATLDLG